MKKISGLSLIIITLLFASGCSLYGASQNVSPTPASPNPTTGQPAAGVNSVNIQNFTFAPSPLTIKAGETVTWTNNDSVPHQIKSAAFNSQLLSQGQSFSFTFTSAGSFDYSCAIHPTMTGKIIVQ